MGRSALIATLIVSLFASSNADSVFIHYEDAACVDTYTIAGTFVMSFDNSDYDAYGFSQSYSGSCIYFKGDSIDLASYDGSMDSYQFGQCITCDGYTGCSSDGTCSNFLSYPPTQVAEAYQMTQGGDQSTKKEAGAPKFGLAAKVKESALQGADMNSAKSEDIGGTISPVVVGAIFGCVAVIGLAIASGGSLMRAQKEDDNSSGMEMSSSPNDSSLVGQYVLSNDQSGVVV